MVPLRDLILQAVTPGSQFTVGTLFEQIGNRSADVHNEPFISKAKIHNYLSTMDAFAMVQAGDLENARWLRVVNRNLQPGMRARSVGVQTELVADDAEQHATRTRSVSVQTEHTQADAPGTRSMGVQTERKRQLPYGPQWSDAEPEDSLAMVELLLEPWDDIQPPNNCIEPLPGHETLLVSKRLVKRLRKKKRSSKK